MPPSLYWLPPLNDKTAFRERIRALSADTWREAVLLANYDLDWVRVQQLDSAVTSAVEAGALLDPPIVPARLAILGSSTTSHLHGAIRVGGLRRNIYVSIYDAEYGQYLQSLTRPDPSLIAFQPTAVLFALDSHHVAAGVIAGMSEAEIDATITNLLGRLRYCWALARERFRCQIIQQIPINLFVTLLGGNEHRLSGSKHAFVTRFIGELRAAAGLEEVDLLSIDQWILRDGLSAWHDARIWHQAKQEVTPLAAPVYGDLVARLIGAKAGRSRKCLVLDLDNTLWGGVIGDDGIGGIDLGQGSISGESYVAFQNYCIARNAS